MSTVVSAEIVQYVKYEKQIIHYGFKARLFISEADSVSKWTVLDLYSQKEVSTEQGLL